MSEQSGLSPPPPPPPSAAPPSANLNPDHQQPPCPPLDPPPNPIPNPIAASDADIYSPETINEQGFFDAARFQRLMHFYRQQSDPTLQRLHPWRRGHNVRRISQLEPLAGPAGLEVLSGGDQPEREAATVQQQRKRKLADNGGADTADSTTLVRQDSDMLVNGVERDVFSGNGGLEGEDVRMADHPAIDAADGGRDGDAGNSRMELIDSPNDESSPAAARDPCYAAHNKSSITPMPRRPTKAAKQGPFADLLMPPRQETFATMAAADISSIQIDRMSPLKARQARPSPHSDHTSFYKTRPAEKLRLILDIDNTLVHTVQVGHVAQSNSGATGVPYKLNGADFLDSTGKPELYIWRHAGAEGGEGGGGQQGATPLYYYIKLRPGVRDFLRSLAPYYDFAIYTSGVQVYAYVVLAILDPERKLFADRNVVCREESQPKEDTKELKKLFEDPRDRSISVIVDDKVGVWINPSEQPLVIQSDPYMFLNTTLTHKAVPPPPLFNHQHQLMADQANLYAGITTVVTHPAFEGRYERLPDSDKQHELTTEIFKLFNGFTLPLKREGDGTTASANGVSGGGGGGVMDSDRQLCYLKELLLKLYRRYQMEGGRREVRSLLKDIRQETLQGVRMQFAGFLGTHSECRGHETLTSSPNQRAYGPFGWVQQDELKKHLESMGAVLTADKDLRSDTTHLAVWSELQSGSKIDTVRQWRQQGASIECVHWSWIQACASTWTRLPETLFEPLPLYAKMPFRDRDLNTPMPQQAIEVAGQTVSSTINMYMKTIWDHTGSLASSARPKKVWKTAKAAQTGKGAKAFREYVCPCAKVEGNLVAGLGDVVRLKGRSAASTSASMGPELFIPSSFS
ncbi:unnamed protein product [Vitrella brassicaformis CCMP3155]|uniref:protein-serine/threonine phosphatase n=2 Tax=Vitrella brassicaformis TaxID=1169539 RepID=A0A0G4ENR8_VITBC|nr:unnamed protein product [Vitrella brassicaformis CCMP3155]|eukprot:CEL99253.1 unnamed protein product [Vitrella brassicaformis CCMP3155]